MTGLIASRGGRLLACCLVMASARAAQAKIDEPDPAVPLAPTRASVPKVEITVVGDFPNADAVGTRVASWFDGQSIPNSTAHSAELSPGVVFTPGGAEGVRLWLVLSAPNAARLFFAVQEHADALPRFLVQEVELSGGVDELGLERLAQVAYLSAVALWEGSAESSRQEMEQGLGVASAKRSARPARPVSKLPAPPSTATTEPRSADEGWHLRSQFPYELSFHGEEGVFMGIGWDQGVAWRQGSNELALLVHSHLFLLVDPIEKRGVRLDLSGLGLGALVGGARRLSNRWWLSGQLGPSFERVSVYVKALSDPSLSKGPPPETSWRPTLFGSAALRLEIGAFKYSLAATVSVPLVRVSYDIADTELPGGREKLIVPWAVQPGFSLGFVF
jgi:hypothetical protein